ncbi:ABC transporter substrate-binding protein [Gulosibacter molinativorax]|uniref:ABC transporter substrate-binding protein n=1 Tax=Gulosibacter molinativorax TaxID=256821 RepID=UPI000407E017|nr:ABC transporter substrate-binding protein [Gulosibacter molinativorax]QUY62815.1 Branched-chain amino acid transport system substrate-binding protein [Gulosibacter molinativorax]
MAAAGALVLSGCAGGGGSGASTADGEPIVVSSVNALSGAGTFPEASEAAQAVFDDYNANGGLDGRPIEYNIFDDKGDPATASQVAREAVENGSVALVGGASALDCEVNHAYYEENDILSVQGTGVDPYCFSTPNISPTNAGPYIDTELSLTYGSEVLGLEKICGLLAIEGSTRDAYQEAIDNWSAATGNELAMLDDTLTYATADYTPYVVQIKEAGCDAVYGNMIEPGIVGLLNASEAQGLDVSFLLLTSGYSEQLASQVTYTGQGIYTAAEFAPYTDESVSGNEDWAALMDEHGINKTAFAQGGYLAAMHFIEVIEGIDGDITRESVNEALRGMTEPIESTMTGTPWIFGPGDSHGSNTAGWPIGILPGETTWSAVADDWIFASNTAE